MKELNQRGEIQVAFGSRVVTIADLCRVELLPPAPYEVTYTPNSMIIGFAFDAQTGRHAFGGSRKVAFQAKPNHLSFVPPDCDVYSQSSYGGEYLIIALDRGLTRPWHKGRRFTNVIDARAIDAAHWLRREMIAGNAVDPLRCERLVQMLEERVACVVNGEHREGIEASWMTPRRLRLADEIIEATLDRKLTVQELATDLGLSAGFFSRSFKAAVGKAPHEYIIDRRMARARALLLRPGLDLTAIAHAAGFASHAHMTTVFRERLEATPSDIRRSMVE